MHAKSLDTIESMCSVFSMVWIAYTNSQGKGALGDLWYPKDEGGLGIQKLWDSFTMTLIWRILTQPSSLWASWVTHYLPMYNSFGMLEMIQKDPGYGENFSN